MRGNAWKVSDQLDDIDLAFLRRDFVTIKIAKDYYGIGERQLIRKAHEAGAVYKFGKLVLFNRRILDDYFRRRVVSETQ